MKDYKIYGVVPVGGKGLRLGLPYSKEMLPQKNFDYYNPVINHLVQKMLLAGADRIVFVHGTEYKEDVKEYFDGEKYVHIRQNNPGFANVLYDFVMATSLEKKDKVIFGLPDSIFDKNPFVEMLDEPGIVCGMFTTDPYSKVDRLCHMSDKFRVKTTKEETHSDWFWGVLKFDADELCRMAYHDRMFGMHTEIGDILNYYSTKKVYGEKYIDLGTWHNYNRYLQDSSADSNIEIEKKYDALNVRMKDFVL